MAPVELEGRALDLIQRNGIRAPRQFGYCKAIDAIVMERLPGESRLETLGDDPETRDRIVDDYVDAMVRLHALDPAPFVEAGFAMPDGPEALRLGQFRIIESMYLAKKIGPEPGCEFLRLWIARNAPAGPVTAAFITGDSFQMMFHEGRLAAVMDLEMACIADPMIDLACFRLRDLGEKTGEAARITRLYDRLSGGKVDLPALRFHFVAFAAATALVTSDPVRNPADGVDYFEYYAYQRGAMRIALEAMADNLGLTLDRYAPPAPAVSRQTVHLDMLRRAVEALPAATEFETYQRSKATAEIAYLERVDRWGRDVDAIQLAEAQELLGKPLGSWAEAEAALEEFVHEAGPEWDERLLRFFYRQADRDCFLADIPQNKRLSRYLTEAIAPLI
jgi:aminoglycoside phosphotransferase (APT) family kinase protein